ncbi:hypothetical protein DL767_002181 [Monosporascus sp. MG133]|nr:hypothetical protein DL767_002181 [Monosporascus sp. MG133]
MRPMKWTLLLAPTPETTNPAEHMNPKMANVHSRCSGSRTPALRRINRIIIASEIRRDHTKPIAPNAKGDSFTAAETLRRLGQGGVTLPARPNNEYRVRLLVRGLVLHSVDALALDVVPKYMVSSMKKNMSTAQAARIRDPKYMCLDGVGERAQQAAVNIPLADGARSRVRGPQHGYDGEYRRREIDVAPAIRERDGLLHRRPQPRNGNIRPVPKFSLPTPFPVSALICASTEYCTQAAIPTPNTYRYAVPMASSFRRRAPVQRALRIAARPRLRDYVLLTAGGTTVRVAKQVHGFRKVGAGYRDPRNCHPVRRTRCFRATPPDNHGPLSSEVTFS